MATISGVVFTVVLFAVFTVSERIAKHQGNAHAELDQFHLASGEDITPQNLGCRSGNMSGPDPRLHSLYPLERVLKRVNLAKQDVVVLHVRLLTRAGSGEGGLMPDQFFGRTEQFLFTRALSVAEHEGKTIHLSMVAANEFWDATLRAAQSLESSTVAVGLSAKMTITEEARNAGVSWERLPEPKPRLTLDIFTPTGQEEVFFLGPHAPHLTPEEIDLLHTLWLRFSADLAPEELHHHDIVRFALSELKNHLSESKNGEILDKLKRHLHEIKSGLN